MKRSFSFAFRGVLACARTERNFRFHLAVAFYVLLASIITGLTAAEWALVLICIGTVTGAELFNTALENLCDALRPEWNKSIGVVKDMTAAAVLMFALKSAALGGIIFFRDEKLTRLAAFIKDHAVLSVLIAASLPIVLYLVFRRYKNDNKISHDHNSRTSQRR
ncbi:MAG: diacylglycerol kinase family protein [Clostridiales bacterium]|nr:diacylglycerol kinase family protein [Clostridiales bacterium]